MGWVALSLANLCCFAVYGADKRRAKRVQWRIPERTLLVLAAIAPAGAFAGMMLFRHKTRHRRFRLLVPLFLLLHAGAVLAYCFIW